uniref:diacylglycerol cholinephosphotransferase n=1 Tax=Plectus sambesii TaxID=2011161 RepID=A0A914VNL3_9BILA
MPVETRSSNPARRRSGGVSSENRSITTRAMEMAKKATLATWNMYVQRDCTMSREQLQRLGDHKYSATDISWLDELCMKKFWDAVVQLYPLWLAPNLITLVGLIINLATVIILSFFSLDAKQAAPGWAYLLAAVGLFMYQTLDATDGKQARRTNSASPLGELFDHGCDSLAQVFVCMNVCLSMQLGDARFFVLLICAFAVMMFYCAHWSTYCTGTLRFAKFDVTEAQMSVISVLVATGLFGPGFWSVHIFGIAMKYIVITASMIMSVWQIGGYLQVIFYGGTGKNGSTVAGTSVIFPLFPLLAVVLPFIMIYSKSTSGAYDDNIVLYCVCFGFVAAKATNRLVIAHMSKSPLDLWDWIYLAPIMMMLNQYYDYCVSEYSLLCVATLFAGFNLLFYCYMICRQFCDFLHINCFTIPSPPKTR